MAESKRVQRLLRVFIALDEHPIIGLSNKDLSVGLGMTPTQISRDLDDLIASGLVVKLDNGNYAYGIKTLQIAERFRKQQERLNARLQELETPTLGALDGRQTQTGKTPYPHVPRAFLLCRAVRRRSSTVFLTAATGQVRSPQRHRRPTH